MFIYNIKHLFEKKHYNPPYYKDYHSHKFIVNFEIQGEISSDLTEEYYVIDTVEFQKHLARFCNSLSDNLNEDPYLAGTSSSTEAMCEMFIKYFPQYLKEQGYPRLGGIHCLSVSVFEGEFRETKKLVNQPLANIDPEAL